MKKITFLIIALLSVVVISMTAKQAVPTFSKAGYFEVANVERQVWNFNVGWRFYKGAQEGAEMTEFVDSAWQVVNCPHGLEYISDIASGSNNYQGEVWYRKHFTLDNALKGKVNKLVFEGVMGKCKIWLNGELLTEHFGGYLPIIVNLDKNVNWDGDNVIAVWTDNSDDPSYPPGKSQKQLDFVYFGGMYRDVWLTSTAQTYITNANEVDKVAGGGVFVHVDVPSDNEALINLNIDIQNDGKKASSGLAEVSLLNPDGELVKKSKAKYAVAALASQTLQLTMKVKNPRLWSPQSPDLYTIEIRLLNRKKAIDGVAVKTGLRKIEMKGKDGLYLNNKLYPGKLMGANRHQDHAVVGNALPNMGQWEDALLLKNAGCDIIRAAHYPADPAFMDACDALGIFFIVATPGWQFWNDNPAFEQYVISDIRNMVRRDRNHPSVIMWEPILNETHYPDYFAEKVHNTVHEEYPYQGAFTACDKRAKGQQYFDVIYVQPYRDFFNKYIKDTPANRKEQAFAYDKEKRCIFTREWGDCVDDWASHNSPSRVARNWGERAQLIQAKHYADPENYLFPCWETFYDTPRQHIGGAIWHSYDHQRGYHPHPFYGGITDIYRQPKYSYYMFASQRNVDDGYDPMVYIAHEMTPFSEPDVTVFSNCEEVRLIVYGQDTLTQNVADLHKKMPHHPVVFKDVYDFMDVKEMSRHRGRYDISLVAEGLIDGKVVARQVRKPALRPRKIELHIQSAALPLVANGSDFITVVASITDADGNVKRLDESYIKFEVEGEGQIIGNSEIMTNPRKLEWGTAPVLIRSTLNAGEITVKASVLDEGANQPLSGTITFSSVPDSDKFIYSEIGGEPKSNEHQETQTDVEELQLKIRQLEQEVNDLKIKEVERQQQEFQ